MDISNFSWQGGVFKGHVFDVNSIENSWAPNVNTRGILVACSENGKVENIEFHGIKGDRIAGAVVSVEGYKLAEDNVERFAENVKLINCNFKNCGKFMWDYGYLWQRIVFDELYSESEVEKAYKYMPEEYMSGYVTITDGTDYITVDNLPSSGECLEDAVVFFNDALPQNIKKGKRYWIIEEKGNQLKLSEQKNGKPIIFNGNGGEKVRLFRQLHLAFYVMYAPEGAGPGKGAFDFTGCKDVIVTGCTVSALGDTMHIHSSNNVIFSNNQITGSRMGAFFIAEHCSNVTVTGNTIQGTNGSRVMSIERSTKNITITGNTFIGGGRGSWINQLYNIILSDNIFIENTTKCEKDPKRGRINFYEGEYENYAEIYFTTWQPDAKYGPVIVRGNIIQTGKGCSAAVTFHSGGENIIMDGNIIKGTTGKIIVQEGCENPIMSNNIGITEIAKDFI